MSSIVGSASLECLRSMAKSAVTEFSGISSSSRHLRSSPSESAHECVVRERIHLPGYVSRIRGLKSEAAGLRSAEVWNSPSSLNSLHCVGALLYSVCGLEIRSSPCVIRELLTHPPSHVLHSQRAFSSSPDFPSVCHLHLRFIDRSLSCVGGHVMYPSGWRRSGSSCMSTLWLW